MSDLEPDAEQARRRRLGRTILGSLFLGWFLGTSSGVALGHVGRGALIGCLGGAVLGVLAAALVGDLRRPRR